MTAARHSWGEPERFPFKSERVCAHCGLIKVTRYEGEEHWVEFWRDTERLAYRNTPPCPGARGTGEP